MSMSYSFKPKEIKGNVELKTSTKSPGIQSSSLLCRGLSSPTRHTHTLATGKQYQDSHSSLYHHIEHKNNDLHDCLLKSSCNRTDAFKDNLVEKVNFSTVTLTCSHFSGFSLGSHLKSCKLALALSDDCEAVRAHQLFNFNYCS